ncbi:hypothetical protein DFP72DRAFT_489028 [Ephemerocybe angulata]|uniref:Transmembrane protein n=1 Tax=Ephemerocybe angulata TaxID=980116 RepID=A0A8H6IGM8_9AGAR|nr:hypothetical protein DFP72DRAFT_489028 [Tulosesus angulatus]
MDSFLEIVLKLSLGCSCILLRDLFRSFLGCCFCLCRFLRHPHLLFLGGSLCACLGFLVPHSLFLQPLRSNFSFRSTLSWSLRRRLSCNEGDFLSAGSAIGSGTDPEAWTFAADLVFRMRPPLSGNVAPVSVLAVGTAGSCIAGAVGIFTAAFCRLGMCGLFSRE